VRPWFIYMVRCADDSLYTGITTDLERRVQEHNDNKSTGAKYTRARQPVKLVYAEQASNRGAATSREIEIKSLDRQNKLKLIAQFEPEQNRLAPTN